MQIAVVIVIMSSMKRIFSFNMLRNDFTEKKLLRIMKQLYVLYNDQYEIWKQFGNALKTFYRI